MAVYRTYECPACKKNFDFLHHPNDEPPPNFCPLCGADVSGKKKQRMRKAERVLSPGLSERIKHAPSVRRTASKSADAVYRGMENASHDRMKDAAEVLGVDPRTLSNMKFTDMKDNMREGDMAQSTTPTDATKITGSVGNMNLPDSGGTGQNIAFNPFQHNAQAAEMVRAGPRAGNGARELVNSLHATKGHSVVAAGRINKKG